VIEGFLVPRGEVAREARSVEGLTSVGPESLAVTPVVSLGDGARPGVMEERGSVTTAVFSFERGAPGCSENVSSYHSCDVGGDFGIWRAYHPCCPHRTGQSRFPCPGHQRRVRRCDGPQRWTRSSGSVW
jgi:hypothetical protein